MLSPATAHIDLGAKLREYQALPRLGSYLVCAQDSPMVSVWTRTAGKDWPEGPDVVSGINGSAVVPHLGITLALREIHRGLAS